ncbi:creatininase family protein [Lachnospiraceae bacterium DSM 108991]|uniref:Creatininase family protein n=1 Tax=Claveliimonas monacensis TaxID=2779351 RepID=A0ABR9RHP1_9FIRM|nr:creatininase family protein [Claveliimonas monacensis]MBE5062483.1 creatininase family protein [Claveliimonas monacensis]
MQKIVFLPWGSHEQHGPLIPADTDTEIAVYEAEQICRAISERHPQYKAVCLPALPFGMAQEHSGFADTVSISYPAAMQFLEEILASYTENETQLRLMVIINGHGGNQDAAAVICHHLNMKYKRTKFMVLHVFSESSRRLAEELFGVFSAHADSVETSVYASINPEVKEGVYDLQLLGGQAAGRHAMKLHPVREISRNGIVSKRQDIIVDREKGKKILERSIRDQVETVEDYLQILAE